MIRVEATHPQFGPLRKGDPPRVGAVFLKDQDTILPLTREQRRLFDLAKGDGVDWTKVEERMAYLAKCKEGAVAVDAILDGYLSNEEYEFRSEAKIDLREDSPEQITLVPVITVCRIPLKGSRTQFAHWNLKQTGRFMTGCWTSLKSITPGKLNLRV
jgi:hypothetical protein